MLELLPAVGAVDSGRLIQLRGDGLQTGQKQKGGKGDALPQMDEQNAVDRVLLACQNVGGQRLDAQRLADGGQHIEEHLFEHQADGDHAQHGGQEVQRAEEGAALELLVQEQRQNHADHDDADNQHDGIAEVEQKRLAEFLIGEQFCIVGKADEVIALADAVPVHEAVINAHQDGKNQENAVRDKTRQAEKAIGCDALAGHGGMRLFL